MRKMIASADRRHRKASPDAVEVAAERPAKARKPAAQLASYEAPQPVATPEMAAETIHENSYFVQIGSFADYENAEQARAVFANQGMDMILLNADGDIGQGAHARKALGDAAHLQCEGRV